MRKVLTVPAVPPDSGRASAKGSARRLHVELYRNTARLYGGRVPQLLDLAEISARMYDRSRKCWTVSADRVDDVLVIAEYRERRFVTVEEVAQ
jgi:hypothetical protein